MRLRTVGNGKQRTIAALTSRKRRNAPKGAYADNRREVQTVIPKYIEKLCKQNLSFYPMPYQYVLFQNKHIPSGKDALINKANRLEKFILSNNGEFEVLSKEPIIIGNNLEIMVYFNCNVIVAKQLDKIIEEKTCRKS